MSTATATTPPAPTGDAQAGASPPTHEAPAQTVGEQAPSAPQPTEIHGQFATYRETTDKTIESLREEIAKLSPKAAPQPAGSGYTPRAHARAVAKFGEDTDPVLLRQFVDSDLSINALDYQLRHEADPGKRISLGRDLQNFESARTNTETAILFRQREAQRTAGDTKPKQQGSSRVDGDTSSIPISVLRNEGQVMPLLTTETPLLAAAIRTGQISYESVVNRIIDPDNDPAGQWNSIVMGLESVLRQGKPIAGKPNGGSPSNAVPTQETSTAIAGMPPAGGAQSGTPQPSRNDRERKQRDVDHVARMRAAAGQ